MAGLSLIGAYSSDSENDDETNEIGAKESTESRIHALPLPECISRWKGVEHHQEVIDDPLNHDGRTRSFKHERGNWATLVYIEYKPEDLVRSWIDSVCSEMSIQGKYQLSELHLSLTRTLVLKYHWIESFADSVKNICRRTKRFTMELGDVEAYCNDERTRTFLAIRCATSDDSLERLAGSLNDLLTEYRLPTYYEDASYHISIMWINGDVEKHLRPLLPSLTASLTNVLLKDSASSQRTIEQLQCKIGNKMYAFPLL